MKRLSIYITLFSLAFIFLSAFSSSYAQRRKTENRGVAHITIKMEDAKVGDTIRLVTFDNIYSPMAHELSQPHHEFTANKNVNGEFVFDIPIRSKFIYISVYKDKVVKSIWSEPFVSILREYIIQPNDKIKIDIIKDNSYHPNDHLINNQITEIEFSPVLKYIKQYRLLFSGNGAAKFKLRYLLDGIINSNPLPFKLDSIGALTENPAVSAGSKILNGLRQEINPLIFNILKADFIGMIEAQQLRVLSSYKRYDLITQYFVHLKQSYSDEVILNSRFYPFFILSKYDIEYPNKIGEKSLSSGAYYFIKQEFKPGELRDKLLFIYLMMHSERLQNSTFDDAKKTIKTPFYLKMITAASDEMTPGKNVYNFELTDPSGKRVRLSDFKGKVVFIDFWFTGCSACKGYFRDIVSKTEEKMSADTNIVFLTISIDRNRDDWVKSVKKGDYTSDKAVNLYTNGEGPLHSVISHYQVQGYPRPVLIDKYGRLFTDKDTDLRSNGVIRLESQIIQALGL
jgi:cytochrome oxidase Cu insertion factor (SCO1/SenC/PrrC family)